jgi:hypothetical protein
MALDNFRYRLLIEDAAFADRYDLEEINDEATLVQSLLENRHEKSLWLDLQGVRDHGWKQAQAILKAQNDLESVVIRGPARKTVERKAAEGFLHAVQQNPNVKYLDLRSISGATLPAYIQSSMSSSLSTLALGNVTFPPDMKLAFPVALGHNTSIRRLVLHQLNQALTIEILNNLATNTTLTDLVFTARRINRPVVLACGRLLAVTKTIQQLELRGIHIHRLGPIADSLIASSSITCVIFRDCHIGQPDVPVFTDQYKVGEDRSFDEILMSKDNMTRLAVCNTYYPGQPKGIFKGITRLLQPGSELCILEIQFPNFAEVLSGHRWGRTWGSAQTADEFQKEVMENLAAFWVAVQNSSLQHLSVAKIGCQEELETILEAIPLLKLCSLVVGVDKFLQCGRTLQAQTQQWGPTRTLRTQLLAAMEKNGSLRKVEVQQNGGKNWFDQVEQARLDSHLNR